jgi:toxin ParE1/3/4
VKLKPVVPRAQANQDIDEAIAYYLEHGSEQVATGFIDALERAFLHIGRHPATGSPRYAHELGIPELRCWHLSRFPQIVFYVEREGLVDVWRVLHEQRDLPAWMREPEG